MVDERCEVERSKFDLMTAAKLLGLAHDIDIALDAYRDALAAGDNATYADVSRAAENFLILAIRLICDQLTVRELLQLAKLIGADSYI